MRSEADGRSVLGQQRVHEHILCAGCVLQQRVRERVPGVQPGGDGGQLHQRGQRRGSAGQVRFAGADDLRNHGPVRGGTVRAVGSGKSVRGGELSDGVDARAGVDLQRNRDVRDAGDDELRAGTLHGRGVREHVYGEYGLHGAGDVRGRILRTSTEGRDLYRDDDVRGGVDVLHGGGG